MEAEKNQKVMGICLIIIGIILTLSIIFAIIGIPLLIFGIMFTSSKKVNPITNALIKSEGGKKCTKLKN